MIKLRIEEFDSRKKRLSELVTWDGESVNLSVDDVDRFEQNLRALNYKFIRTFGGDFDGSDFDAYSKRVGDFDITANYFYPSCGLGGSGNICVTYASGKSGDRSMEDIDAMLSDLDLGSIEGLKELERILLRITNESVRRNGRCYRLVRESADTSVCYVVFRKYYNDYTGTFEPIAFWYSPDQKESYGKICIIEQDGNIPFSRGPRYVNDYADISYYNATKKLTRDDDCYDEFTSYVFDWLSKDSSGDGFDKVIENQRINRDLLAKCWRR